MPKLWAHLKHHGYHLMTAGFIIAILSLIAMIMSPKMGTAFFIPHKALFYIGISGFVVYALGRAGVAGKRSDQKKEYFSSPAEKQNETGE